MPTTVQNTFKITFNRKLINKTNKQLTVTRGEGISGEKGEGFAGTIMKDTGTLMGRGWKWEKGREG